MATADGKRGVVMTEPEPGGCFFHHDEPPPTPDDFLCCGECGHVFHNEAELVNAVRVSHEEYRANCPRFGIPDPGPLVTIDPKAWAWCPYCTHDF
jgi:hypothetical protein